MNRRVNKWSYNYFTKIGFTEAQLVPRVLTGPVTNTPNATGRSCDSFCHRPEQFLGYSQHALSCWGTCCDQCQCHGEFDRSSREQDGFCRVNAGINGFAVVKSLCNSTVLFLMLWLVGVHTDQSWVLVQKHKCM